MQIGAEAIMLLRSMRGFVGSPRQSPARVRPAPRPEAPRSARVQQALALQRTVGNTVFRQLLQRDPTPGWDLNKKHTKFKRTRHTDPNRIVKKGKVELRNVLLQGLKHGFQGAETRKAVGSAGDAVED